MEFGDLKDDKVIQEKLQNFHNSIDKIENLLKLVLNSNVCENLSTNDQVNYDLFMGYALNTLFWLYLRTKGVDPNKSEIKDQLFRIRQYMVRAKEAHARNTIRPKIDQDVAKRFIKHGIHQSQNTESQNSEEPPRKKKK